MLQTPSAVALLGTQTGYTGRSRSAAFRWFTDPGARWERHEVGLRSGDTKRSVHPEIGRLDLYCQLLLKPDQG
ncbi:hypothetical protein [Nocardia elegans]|uniref:MmyB-like transcription regulator ligand binding domain-containing protein n=1 Tax=Nocardia elegans TaxID=300029 RepID=A0ABW6TKY1_9NOCA|nr:hypothetical protein [Nocardia elegans]